AISVSLPGRSGWPVVPVVTHSVGAHSGSPRRIATGDSRRILRAVTRSVPDNDAAAAIAAAAITGQSTRTPVAAGPPVGEVTYGGGTASRPNPTPRPTAAGPKTPELYSKASGGTTFLSLAPSASKDAASYS